MISYEGIDEATLIHGLYHGQASCGRGTPALVQELISAARGGVTVESVRAELADWPRRDGRLYIDYFHGRALKIKLDPETQKFDERLYDRDAGPGAAKDVVDRLLAKAA